MPTYEYLCQECGERLEVFQKFTDKTLTVHPGCGGPLQKIFHASGVVFKGSGYYVTDSRPNGKSSATTAKSDSDSSGDSAKSENKGDGKGDGKSDAKSGKSEKSDKAATSDKSSSSSTSD